MRFLAVLFVSVILVRSTLLCAAIPVFSSFNTNFLFDNKVCISLINHCNTEGLLTHVSQQPMMCTGFGFYNPSVNLNIISQANELIPFLLVLICLLLVWIIIENVGWRRKLKKQELSIRQRELKDQAIIERLFGQISQDIRTPLNGIVGMTELLKQLPFSEKQEEYINLIAVSSINLETVVSDLTEYSKFAKTEPVLEKVSLSIHDIVAETSDALLDSVLEKRLHFNTFVDPSVPFYLIGDPVRLRQVILAICRHAIHRTPRGEVYVSVETHRTTANNIELKFKVKDHGEEISKADIETMLSEVNPKLTYLDFLDTNSLEKFQIIKQIIEVMGGQLGVETTSGTGTNYWFTAAFTKSINEHHPSPESFKLSGLHLLLFDENSVSRNIFRKYLDFFNCTYTEADSIESVKNCFATSNPRQQAIDVVLLVVNNQATPIEEFRNVLTKSGYEGKIIMISNTAYILSTSTMLEMGFSLYLNKPVKLLSLYNALVEVAHTKLQINWDYPKKPVFPKSESNKKILLVEDNLINEKVAVATLSRLGFVVDTAPNGLVALQKFKESTYDLIFMDIQMPEMDGIEATIQIREYERVHALTHPTPIIALTAISHPKDKERCKLVGMNDYIVKPFRIDDLARILTIRNT